MMLEGGWMIVRCGGRIESTGYGSFGLRAFAAFRTAVWPASG
jgi:hypothetical protein